MSSSVKQVQNCHKKPFMSSDSMERKRRHSSAITDDEAKYGRIIMQGRNERIVNDHENSFVESSSDDEQPLFVEVGDGPTLGHVNSAPATAEIRPHSTSQPPRSPHKTTPRRRRLRSGAASISGSGSMAATSVTKMAPEPIVRSGNRTIYTQGRPPWYDTAGHIKEPFVIGICGGSASGKTTVAKSIIESLDVPWVSLLSMDSFYKALTPEQKALAHDANYNFDHPSAFDVDLLVDTLRRLKEGKSVKVPIYDFSTHSRLDEVKMIYGANVVIFEGILAFVSSELLELMDLKVFVDTDSDERLARRLKRDIADRGRELGDVLAQYNRFVKPAYDQFIAPTMTHADIIVPRGGGNQVAINLISQHVNKQLEKRGTSVRKLLVMELPDMEKRLPDTLHLMTKTKQLQCLHTFIRNRETQRDEFIFYSNRLMRLLCEYALSFLPYVRVTVETPQGSPYSGWRLAGTDVCGVSIVRAGETLEPALCAVCKEVRLGKILIQTNRESQEPELHYIRLPKGIADSQVLLMDSTVATGAAAIMAIRVLLEHDVPQERITLVSLLMSLQGVHAIAYVYPNVRIITTAIDEVVNEHFHIIPGIGNFGDRYFGTGTD